MSQCSVIPALFLFLFIRFLLYIFIPTVDFKYSIFKLTDSSFCLSYPAIDVFFLIFNFISCSLQLKNFFLPILNCFRLLWSHWSLDVFLCVFFLSLSFLKTALLNSSSETLQILVALQLVFWYLMLNHQMRSQFSESSFFPKF